MLIAAILMGLLAYLIYSLKIIYSIAWSLEEVVTELVIPMVLICVSLNIAISVFWGSGLLLSDTNIDSMLALPIPLRTLILSKLTVLFMVEVALTVALLLPMMVLFGLTADMGFPFYLIVLGITIIFPVIPGLLGTMIGTQIYRILKSSSARIARLKAAAAILVLFAFMIFMFCKFPDIAAGNFGDVISTSTFTLYADQYIHRLLNGDYLFTANLQQHILSPGANHCQISNLFHALLLPCSSIAGHPKDARPFSFVTLQQPAPETGCYPCSPSDLPSAHPPKVFLPNGRYG